MRSPSLHKAIIFLFIFLFFIPEVYAEKARKDYIVLKCRNAGMFSIFNDVLLLLDTYEKGFFSGIEVNFAKEGFYYDPSYSPNWWTYYCEPIRIGKKNSHPVKKVDGHDIPHGISREKLRAYNRKKASLLIQKYIHLKPAIREKCENFVAQHFKDHYVIGVHYRGTDKEIEAPRTPYKKVENKVREELRKRHLNMPYRIFIATDEEPFLNYMLSRFPDKVCCYDEALRSKNKTPVHQHCTQNQYKSGEGAILDCVLLSRANVLIRTSSNLSLWSGYFNPNLPIINLSERYVP